MSILSKISQRESLDKLDKENKREILKGTSISSIRDNARAINSKRDSTKNRKNNKTGYTTKNNRVITNRYYRRKRKKIR